MVILSGMVYMAGKSFSNNRDFLECTFIKSEADASPGYGPYACDVLSFLHMTTIEQYVSLTGDSIWVDQ